MKRVTKLVNLRPRKEQKTQINKNINERGNFIAYATEIQS